LQCKVRRSSLPYNYLRIRLIAKHSILLSHFVYFHDIHRVASITVNAISSALDIASLVVGRAVGVFANIFGIVYFVLSACGLYGAIEYQTGHVMMAVVGYWIKAVLTIIGLIAIRVMFDDKDVRYERNGKTYEISIYRTLLIICGVFCKCNINSSYYSFLYFLAITRGVFRTFLTHSYNLSLFVLYLAFAVILFYLSAARVNAKLIDYIKRRNIRNPS